MVIVECSGKLPVGVSRIFVNKLANQTYRAAGGRGRASMDVQVVGDRVMRRLNRRFRNKDATTDVLSFGYGEDAPFIPTAERGRARQLGDVVICLPRVRRQARQAGRSLKSEFAVMVVHGTLHLLGFDHETKREEKEMFGLQRDILARMGIE